MIKIIYNDNNNVNEDILYKTFAEIIKDVCTAGCETSEDQEETEDEE